MSIKKEKRSFPISWKKPLSWLMTLFVITLAYLAYVLFFPSIYTPDSKVSYLYIKEKSSFEDVVKNLENSTKSSNSSTFSQASALLRYGSKIRAGKYEIKNGMNNFQLVRILRSGKQTPVKLSFNNIRTKEQLAGRIAEQLMADSISILQLLNDSAYLSAINLNPYTSITLFIPNTYEMYWNTDAKELFERMNKEYTKFWTPERKAKADSIPLTLAEVSTLASIVEEETNNKKDRPMVAGLYINRLKAEMPLQADPTVKFAVGDFTIKRILFGHLRTQSPYNTYKNTGLPPGPIRVATEAGIDAVLNYSKHNYIYMCASETLNGEHKFAADWDEHSRNAKKYQEELNKRKIFK